MARDQRGNVIISTSFENIKLNILTRQRLVSTERSYILKHVRIFLSMYFCFNWDSFHARLKQPLQGMELQEKKHKKIKAYRKSVKKETTVKRCLLILDLKPFRS